MKKKRPGEVFEAFMSWLRVRPVGNWWKLCEYTADEMRAAFERGRKYEREGK